MVKLEDIKVGSIVIVRTNFGSGAAIAVEVESVEKNVKNGFPGIDYTIPGGGKNASGWAYLTQVDRIINS